MYNNKIIGFPKITLYLVSQYFHSRSFLFNNNAYIIHIYGILFFLDVAVA